MIPKLQHVYASVGYSDGMSARGAILRR